MRLSDALKNPDELQRILKTPEGMALLPQLHALAQQLDTLTTAIRSRPDLAFLPNRPQEEFLRAKTWGAGLFSGNRMGKSTAAVLKSLALSMGYHPFLAPEDPDYFLRLHWVTGAPRIEVPNVGRFGITDYKAWERDVVNEWEKWIPKGTYRYVRNTQNNVTKIVMQNRSVIHIMTREMDDITWEGGKIDWAVFNEPPKEQHFKATLRGLVDTHGPWYMCLTLLDSEPWIFDQVWERGLREPEKITIIEGSTEDNLIERGGVLTREAVEDFASFLTEAEYAARVMGRPIYASGQVFKQYRPTIPWRIDPVPIRSNWLRVMAIDPHPQKPFAALWGVVDPYTDTLHLIHELYSERIKTIEEFADQVKKIETEILFDQIDANGNLHRGPLGRPTIRWIDPAASEPVTTDKRTNVQRELAKHGVYCARWDRADKDNRIMVAQDWLRPRVDSGNPVTQVWTTCPRLDYELRHWYFEPKTGKPKKTGNDLIDCWLAFVSANVIKMASKFVPEAGSRVHPLKWGTFNKTTTDEFKFQKSHTNY